MRQVIPAAFALAALCACMGSYTSGPFNPGDGGIPISGLPGGADAGDGGTDAGGGMDAGSDAGCTALSLNTTSIIDSCLGGGLITTGSVSVNTASCTATINTGSNTGPCVGPVSGSHDAFNGACGGYSPCISPALPGIITCTTGPTSSCNIVVCDGGC